MSSTVGRAVQGQDVARPIAAAGPARRLDWLDAVRGIALLGVILVHTSEYAAPASAELAGVLAHSPLDLWVERIVHVFIAEKAQTLFTVMFGISFAIQIGRLTNDTDPARARSIYLRRLVGLLLIAAVDVVVLPTSDILNYYALAGFALLLAARWRLRTLLTVGLLLALLARPTQQLLSNLAAGAGADPGPVVGNIGLPVIAQSGSYLQITLAHWHSLWFVEHLWFGLLGFLPYVFGRFLIGVAFVRTGLAIRPAEHRRALCLLAVAGVPLGLALSLSGRFGHGSDAAAAAVLYLMQAGTLILALGYLALLLAASLVPAGRAALAFFVPVGRMALTNYLLQAVFNSFVFFGFGLGLIGRLGAAACASLALGLFTLQCAASRWWLAHHPHGPVEWLWRAWTYRTRPAWRADPRAAAPVRIS
jgi:uncharacterized protein